MDEEESKDKEASFNKFWSNLQKEGRLVIVRYSETVLEDIFEERFKYTIFMKFYMRTPRRSPLSEIISDLKQVMPYHTHDGINEFAKEHKDDPISAVMHIWTQWTAVTQLINFSLMLDGYYTFGISDIDKDYVEQKINQSGHTYEEVLEYTIKFIRMVNY